MRHQGGLWKGDHWDRRGGGRMTQKGRWKEIKCNDFFKNWNISVMKPLTSWQPEWLWNLAETRLTLIFRLHYRCSRVLACSFLDSKISSSSVCSAACHIYSAEKRNLGSGMFMFNLHLAEEEWCYERRDSTGFKNGTLTASEAKTS